jgi:hypothetical protein
MLICGLIAGVALAMPAPRALEFTDVDLEFAVANSSSNDVAIPAETGTRFSLTDDLDADPARCFRLRLGWRLSGRQQVMLLAAPLRLVSSGRAPWPIDFAGTTFPEGSRLEARYHFDSYRMTYRYALHRDDRWAIDVGLTLKVRVAEISLRAQELRTDYDNVGFVPLLYARLERTFHHRWRALLEIDALAAPQGRAEDLFCGVGYTATERLQLRAGYRLLEGGADVEEVYTFALIHYAAFGVRLRL